MQDIIIRAICITLIHSLWQALLLAVVAAVLMMLTKKMSSATRYKLLCSLLIVFAVTVLFTFYRQLNTSADSVTAIAFSSPAFKKLSVTNLPAVHHFISDSSIHKLTNTCSYYFNRYSWVLFLLWFAAFLFQFVRLLVGMVNAERMRYYKTTVVTGEWNEKLEGLCKRLHIHTPVLLMESALLKIPVLIGYVKPVILIPVGMLMQLPAEQAEAILLHELAHVRRHDYLVNLVQIAIESIFFFNPAVLWISSLIRSERENCCDDMAICETKSRKQFIEALVSFNKYSNTINTAYSLSWVTGKSQLLQRVQRIVTKKNNSLRFAEVLVLLTFLMLTGTAFITLRHAHQNFAKTTRRITAKKINPDIVVRTAHTSVARPLVKIKTIKKIEKPVTEPANTVPLKIIQEKPISFEATVIEPIEEDVQPASDLTAFQKQLEALGYTEHNLHHLQEYKDHGLSAEYIESIQRIGYTNVQINLLIELKDHGVVASFLADLKRLGYGIVPLEKAMELVDHGVSAEYIESFRKPGFKNITLGEAIELRDHGITSTFVELFKKKTGQYLLPGDYIKLKDSGINPV